MKFLIRAAFLLLLFLSLSGLFAQSFETREDVAKLVGKATNPFALLNRMEELRVLRRVAFRGQWANDLRFHVECLWGLVRYEYAMFAAVPLPSDKKSQAWYLAAACRKFLCISRKFVNQESWAKNALLAHAYAQEANNVLGVQMGRQAVEEKVLEELLDVFSPTGTHPANRNIQTTVRNTIKDAQNNSKVVIYAEFDALNALKTLYGLPPKKPESGIPESESKQFWLFTGMGGKLDISLFRRRDVVGMAKVNLL